MTHWCFLWRGRSYSDLLYWLSQWSCRCVQASGCWSCIAEHHDLMSFCPQSCLRASAGRCSCPTRRQDGSTQRSETSRYCDGCSATERAGELNREEQGIFHVSYAWSELSWSLVMDTVNCASYIWVNPFSMFRLGFIYKKNIYSSVREHCVLIVKSNFQFTF